MSNHTLGPWTIDGEGREGASLLVRAGHIGIAEVWKTDDRIHIVARDTVGQANAQLIANAPHMLDTLRAVALFAFDDPRTVRRIAEAAIAKVEGKAVP